tara:strand:- start:60 stop:803 length:744 start_codon:yes stop_codon:yes gene_type:complete
MREYRINKIPYIVYDSVNEIPPNIRSRIIDNWKTAEIGDWVTADDGAVMEVLRKGSMGRTKGKDRIRYNIGTCTGTYPCVKGAKFSSEKMKNIYSFGGRLSIDYILSRDKLTRKEEVFVGFLSTGMPMQEAYLKAFPTNDEGYALSAAKILTSTERIITAMKKELEPVMEELGITPEYVLGTIKIMADDAERDDTRLKALMKLSDILDLEDKSTTKITQLTGAVFQGFSDKQLKDTERPLLDVSRDE